ncbi:conserved hypothetical protein [Theileria orientalis strain Shintoku]|uniref:Uncharacterized protein n=1 Tax=Theileria orientalis strain Shintoku TaxID=869250 RepID=J4CDD6_THEOR|nr:conserved hypothetical protein [Theileria orientalis strain Shintoku]BAM40957.1 conserved hypothetical protein [Theileria orientalis strain Shintoku]|eukprot:XP_009691258.1 conserved hypothetical protein [Theileria orientalis strain Shintoku]
MTSISQDRSFEQSLNQFIDNNIDPKFLFDLEDPGCRLVSPKSLNESPSTDKSSKTLNMLNDIKSALNDATEYSKSIAQQYGSNSSSSKNLVDRNAPTSKNDILEHAESVIEYQRERINILEKTLQKYNIAITKTAELHKDELDEYEKKNKEMRVQMQTVISDYDAISKRYKMDMENYETLKGKSLKSDYEILKKDKQINELERKLELYPKENDLLRSQNNDLMNEVKALKNELFPPMKSWQRDLDRAPTEHVMTHENQQFKPSGAKLNDQYKPIDIAKPHVLCDVRKQETAAMGRCLMQVENDLSTYKRLYDDQRSEIQRLNNLLNTKGNKEMYHGCQYFGSHKQLMNLRDLYISMMKTSTQVSQEKKVKVEETQTSEDRSLHAAYMLKANAEQREMYDKLLEVVKNVISVKSSSTSFYRCKTDYCKLVELNEFDLNTKFRKMLIEVDDSKLLVHQLEDDQIVQTDIVAQENLRAVRTDYKNLQLILKGEHYHVFRFDTSDAYNRFYYALQYAGFLVDDSKLSIYSKVDLNYLSSEEKWPQDLVPVLFSKVVTINTYQYNQKLIQNYNMVMSNVQIGMSPMGKADHVLPNQNMELHMNSLFENVNVISEFTPSLLYYDQNSNLLVLYGPNLANKPKVVNPANTYKFKILNDLEYSNVTKYQDEGEEDYVDFYQVPFATFPNGEPVMEHFNPQLTNYSLVSLKNTQHDINQLNGRFGQMANLNPHMAMQSPSSYTNSMGNASPYNFNNPMNMGFADYEFEVYYLLPLTPRYNDQLSKLINKMDFLRLKLTSPDMGDEQLTDAKDSSKFYNFVDGALKISFAGIGAVTFPCSETRFKCNSDTLMITIVPSSAHKEGSTSYAFAVSSLESFRDFVEDAERNGMKLILSDESPSHEKTCIVKRGSLNIFEKGPKGELLPFLSYKAEETDVKINSKKRSLHIVPRGGGDLVLNMDCLEEDKFNKWLIALKVGGFIASSEGEPEVAQGAEMAEFKFEIKSYNEQDMHEKRSVRVLSDKIVMFGKPSDQKPIFIWERATMNVEKLEKPKIRIALKRNTKYEECFDLSFTVPYLYDDTVDMLHKHNYKLEQPFTKRNLRCGYILAEPNVIRIFKLKYERDHVMVLRVDHYQEPKLNMTELMVKLVPNVENKRPVRMKFKKRETFTKFTTALRVANFVPFVRGLTPKLYRPEIVYGFACPEAKEILKNNSM